MPNFTFTVFEKVNTIAKISVYHVTNLNHLHFVKIIITVIKFLIKV